MSNQTRKYIWPVSLAMSLALVGVLVAFVAMAGPQTAQAHGPCNFSDGIGVFAECVAAGGDDEHTHDGSTPEPNEPPVVVPGILSDVSLRISMTYGPIDVSDAFTDADDDTLTYGVMSDNPNIADATVQNGMMTIIAGNVRGTATITVTANDGKSGMASTSFEVKVAEAYILTAEPAGDPMLPPPPTSAVDPFAKLRMIPDSAVYVASSMGAYDAKFNLAVAGSQDDVTVTITASEDPDGGITITDSDGLIGAGFVDDEETDLEGSFTVKATDSGSRAFEIEGMCEQEGAWAYIVVEDKDLDPVAEGAILCKAPEPDPPAEDEITVAECYSVTGYMGDDVDEAMDQMRDDIEPHERPAHPTNPEMGQDTIQILEGSADVQITVTSCEEGPVYIRFLDSDGDVFGTDIDECETCEGASGADVVGLDSQQKLELNLGPTDMDAAMALMYDQYNVVTPGSGADKYLVGKPGMYHRGTFRFIAPCDWEPFEVEVYEKDGKALQELENGMFSQTISCVAAEQAEAQPIEVIQGSRADREMIVRWQPIADAVEYTVAVLDTSDAAMYTVAYVAMFDPSATRETTVTGLTSGTRYIYAVYAELPGGTYSPVEFVINAPEF